MRFGILVLFVNSFGQKGFYNSQEIGLAKEIARRGNQVTIYKCVDSTHTWSREALSDTIEYCQIPVKNLGNNAVSSFAWLDTTLDVLVCFSDIQLCTTRVYHWAKKHHIAFVPYVGVTYSRSESAIRRLIMNLMAESAFATYRKSGALAKTDTVVHELKEKGVVNVSLAPVGLDVDFLQQNYKVPREDLLKELGLSEAYKYILMVGRIDPDRNPLDVVTVFERLHETDKACRLLIIGKGTQKEELLGVLEKKKLNELVIWIEQVPNSEMWKYYRVSSALVSFNRTEIFGMSILEAMYYELPVFVIHAPGPDDIIVDGESGFLFDTPESMAEEIVVSFHEEIGENEHLRIAEHFSWGQMVDAFETHMRKADYLIREVAGSYDSVFRFVTDTLKFNAIDLLKDDSIKSIQSKKDGAKNGLRAIYALRKEKACLREAGTIMFMGNYGTLYLLLLNKIGAIKPDRIIWWGFFLHSTKMQRLLRPVLHALYKDNVKLIVFSEYEKKLYKECLGLPEECFIFVPYGDWSNLGTTEHTEQTGEYYFSGGYSNRDYRTLLDVWDKTIRKPLVIIGSKNNKDLAEYVTNKGNSHVEVLFDAPSDVFDERLSHAKACILPFRENTGASGQSVTLRCMRLGKLVIGTDTDVMHEYVEPGKSGFLFRTSEELAQIIDLIEKKKVDVRSMLERQKEVYETRFSFPVISKKLEEAIRNHS